MKRGEQEFLMGVAKLSAARSKAIRLKVGGVVTDANGNMIASGYNGGIRGLQDEELETKIYEKDESNGLSASVDDKKYPYYDVDKGYYRLVTNEDVVVHSEQNILAHAARRGISINGGVMVLTHSPCMKCVTLLIQAGISEVIYNEEYRMHSQVEEKYGRYIKFTKH